MKKITIGLTGVLLAIMFTSSAWAQPGIRIDLVGNGFGLSVSDGHSGYSTFWYNTYRPYSHNYSKYYSGRPFAKWNGHKRHGHHHHGNKHWGHHKSSHHQKKHHHGHQVSHKRSHHKHFNHQNSNHHNKKHHYGHQRKHKGDGHGQRQGRHHRQDHRKRHWIR